jgi:flagellar basal-body rod protein FlgF
MDPLATTAAAGMIARMRSLDLVANNLANAATSGYKAEHDYHQILADPSAPGGGSWKLQWADQAQGILTPTGKMTDIAISGPGFFVVEGKNGPLLTRNGSFRQLPGGELATTDGYLVRNAAGGPISLRPGVPFEVMPDGSVRQDGSEVGRLEIAEVADASQLQKMGNSLFDPKNAGPLRAIGGTVEQGSLEGSNVSVVESSTRMISVMRQYESLQKALTLNSDMNRKTIEEVARVSGG